MKIMHMRSCYKLGISLVHFVLCVLLSGSFFLSEIPGVKTVVAREGTYVSDGCETMMVRVLTYLVCCLLIYWGWQLFFFVVDVLRGKEKRVSGATVILFGCIYAAGLVLGLIFYPDKFAIEVDNYTIYAQARTFVGTYWQSVFMGCIYGAAAMIFHHGFGIFFFQWTLFVTTMAFVFCGLERMGKDRYKYCTLFLLILPESYYLIFNAYRNDIYALLLMFYISYIFFLFTLKRKPGNGELIWMTVLSAFMMVFRSEGILIGVTGIAFIMINLRGQWKRILMIGLVFVVSFVAVKAPQDMGAEKYYGQDYMILNTTPVLHSIFNDPGVNLSYAGAKGDLAAIEEVVPVQVLKESGMSGYRNYNWTCGRKSFNQSLSSDDVSSAYMKAYFSIVMHNPSDYLNVQMNAFCKAFGLPKTRTTYSFEGKKQTRLDKIVYDKWKIGKKLVFEERFTERWSENRIRISLQNTADRVIRVWRKICMKTPLNALLHVMSIIIICVLCLKEFIAALMNKCCSRLGFAFLFLVIIGEYVAIMLFMPDDRAAYLYPTLYAGYLSLFLYMIVKNSSGDNFKTEAGT